MLKFASAWVIALVCFMSFGCNKAEIRGTVQGVGAKPLPGVKAFIENSTFATETDSGGKYVLAYAPGAFTIRFEKEGYIAQSLELNLATAAHYDAPVIKLPRELTRGESGRGHSRAHAIDTGRG